MYKTQLCYKCTAIVFIEQVHDHYIIYIVAIGGDVIKLKINLSMKATIRQYNL